MKPIQFITRIHNGKTNCGSQIVAALKCFEGKWVSIEIKERKRGRRNSQNRFYWGCVVPIIVDMLRELGNDVDMDTAHEFLKSMFIPPSGIKKTKVGKITHEARSSTWLSTAEWEEYVERIRVFAAENGYIIPFPGEDVYGI